MEINNSTHDLVIRNGKIIDGSGKKPFFGDVAIDDGKITSVGKIENSGKDLKENNNQLVKEVLLSYHQEKNKRRQEQKD